MRIYENPKKTSENRMKARSRYIPSGSCEFQLLNGAWRFSYNENGDAAQEITRWVNVEVPSCWDESKNENLCDLEYPFPYDPPYVPDINPVGVYEREFIIEKQEYNHYLVLEGASSCAEVYINGKYVGFTQGSHLLAEFNITEYVMEGSNTVRVNVRKWCCGSYLEAKETFGYNGIFRDVYILSRPEGHIFDIDIRTMDDSVICLADKECTVSVYKGETLVATQYTPTGRACLNVENPVLWNGEKPFLYTVKIEAVGEVITKKIGFRKVELSKNKELLINGTELKLKAINCNTDFKNGGCMTDEELLSQVELIKSLNVNCIFAGDCPPAPKFLDYCDEKGLYVVLGPDLKEKQGNGCNWSKEFLERTQRTYEINKLHPSVVMWWISDAYDDAKEFLESKEDGRLIGKGVIGDCVGEGENEADIEEIKNTYAPFRLSVIDNGIMIENKYSFTSFDNCTFEYEITLDGELLEKRIVNANISSGESFKLPVSIEIPKESKYGCYALVKMKDSKGADIGALQAELPTEKTIEETTAEPLEIKDNEFAITVIGNGFKYIFSKQLAMITSIIINDTEQLTEPMALSFMRGIDNSGSERIFNKIYDVAVKGNEITVKGSCAKASEAPFVSYTLTYSFFTDGKIKIDFNGKLNETLERLGFEFKLDYKTDKFRYFGNGPLESYSDVCHHGDIGWHEGDSAGEGGNHTNVKRLEMADSLVFTANDTVDFSVCHSGVRQTENEEEMSENERSYVTVVRIDCKESGKAGISKKQVKFGFAIM